MNSNYLLLFIIFFLISCKKEKKHHNIQSSSITKKELVKSDSIPNSFLLKNSKKIFFSKILNENKILKKEIIRANNNQIKIDYKETNLEKKLVLCQFIIQEDVEFDYLFRNNQMIYKSTTSINRAHFYYEYKDWDYDKKPELITYYKEWEGGANLGYRKIKNIYEIKKDTVLNIVRLNLEEVFCQNGISSYIKKYEYKYIKKEHQLNIKEIIGNGDCDKYIIKKKESISNKKYIVKGYNNVL